ncbi:hypothetical protein [Streptomyces sp. NBC_01205]|uniref:hypothetical protein n=1 Tax=Streptomyces sp. NBC_01205 TaxID=2903771 RepID=UPI002E0EB24E|nr:hypothetical protein OG573_35270 [Streptomyces sp. NBC_01205]
MAVRDAVGASSSTPRERRKIVEPVRNPLSAGPLDAKPRGVESALPVRMQACSPDLRDAGT